MEKQYALALWKLVEGGMKPAVAVSAISARLSAEGRSLLLPRVGREFSRIAEREQKRRTMVLTVARTSDVSSSEKEAKEAAKKAGIPHDTFETRVDDTIIGGWRLEGDEHLLDASHKQQLLDLYARVTRER